MKNFSEYDYLTDSIFVLNDKNKICYTNLAYKTNFNNAQKDIKKLAGYFDFDICILDNSNTNTALIFNEKHKEMCELIEIKNETIRANPRVLKIF